MVYQWPNLVQDVIALFSFFFLSGGVDKVQISQNNKKAIPCHHTREPWSSKYLACRPIVPHLRQTQDTHGYIQANKSL